MLPYTKDLIRILDLAQNSAASRGNKFVATEDLLAGILQGDNVSIANLFNELKLSQNDLLLFLRSETKTNVIGNFLKKALQNRLPYDSAIKNILNEAKDESQKFHDDLIAPVHLLLALLKEETPLLSKVWSKFQINYDQVVKAYQTMLTQINSQTPYLDKYGDNLTEKAGRGEIDEVIGRYDEIARVIQILSRRHKNNPVLYGEPGVGKTAIVEGIARKIVQGDIPDNLKNKKIIELSLNSVIAGASKRGEYEERLNKIIAEVKNSANEIILFIDEIHTLVKTDDTGDTANILKPALARGEIQAIGATTVTEYRQYFEKDAALERRFQPVYIEEPTAEECLFILKKAKTQYEKFHGIEIPEELLSPAIELSQKYLVSRFLPDKVFDLIDEACAFCKTPQINIREKITAQKELIAFHQNELQNAKNSGNNYLEQKELEKISELTKNLQNLEQIDTAKQKILTKEHLAEIISRQTGIPFTYLQESEKDRYLKIEEYLNTKIIGQNEAIKEVTSAVLRTVAGLKKKDRPIGSFIFMGKTGVGKTELAETVAEYLFGTKDALVRFDMSEFVEKHTVSKLIGAPPGYIGFEEGGQLTQKIRLRPYSLILFDEIEKAHPEVLNLLLQILDEGHLTDNQGHRVNFKNTIIICTSNLGTDKIDSASFHQQEKNNQKTILVNELKNFLRLELINRFDDLIYFKTLAIEDLLKILELLLIETKDNLAEKNIHLELTDNAKQKLIEKGYDADLGARPLQYVIQQEIETKLAELILSGKIANNTKVICDYQNNQFIFQIIPM